MRSLNTLRAVLKHQALSRLDPKLLCRSQEQIMFRLRFQHIVEGDDVLEEVSETKGIQ